MFKERLIALPSWEVHIIHQSEEHNPCNNHAISDGDCFLHALIPPIHHSEYESSHTVIITVPTFVPGNLPLSFYPAPGEGGGGG